MSYNGLTNQGLEYLTRCQVESKPVVFSKVKIGNGNIPMGSTGETTTDLYSFKKEIEILNKEQVENSIKMEILINNFDVLEEFYVKEIGVYVMDNDIEKLYWYINKDRPSPLPDKNTPAKHKYILHLETSQMESIILNYTGADLLVDKEFVEEKLNEVKDRTKALQFSDIESMKQKNLKVGDIVEVLGYYTAGDGAGHKRIIANEDDGSGVQLTNKLWANIVHNGEVDVSWFGAKGDGINDDTEAIQKSISKKEIDKVIFQCNKKYKVTKPINITTSVDGNNAYIIKETEPNTPQVDPGFLRIYDVANLYVKNINIIDQSLSPNQFPNIIVIQRASNIKLLNIYAESKGEITFSPIVLNGACHDININGVKTIKNNKQPGSIQIRGVAGEVYNVLLKNIYCEFSTDESIAVFAHNYSVHDIVVSDVYITATVETPVSISIGGDDLKGHETSKVYNLVFKDSKIELPYIPRTMINCLPVSAQAENITIKNIDIIVDGNIDKYKETNQPFVTGESWLTLDNLNVTVKNIPFSRSLVKKAKYVRNCNLYNLGLDQVKEVVNTNITDGFFHHCEYGNRNKYTLTQNLPNGQPLIPPKTCVSSVFEIHPFTNYNIGFFEYNDGLFYGNIFNGNTHINTTIVDNKTKFLYNYFNGVKISTNFTDESATSQYNFGIKKEKIIKE